MGNAAYYGLDSAWLSAELTKWQAAHSALALGQSYNFTTGNGVVRSLTRVNLQEVRMVMRDIQAEIQRQAGTTRRPVTYPEFER